MGEELSKPGQYSGFRLRRRRGAVEIPSGWAIGVVVLLIVLGLVAAADQVLRLERELVESLAVEDASRFTGALREFRSIYTSEVVAPAQSTGTMITHDYRSHPGALPLPATLSMLLGKRLAGSDGGEVRLFSDYPFPWKSAQEIEMDAFQHFALKALRKDPDQPIHRFEDISGQLMIRYATSDRMRSDCVECHNTHPDSPKRDWVVGDVRGVLEVTRPVVPKTIYARSDLRGMIRKLVGIAILALIGLGLGIVLLRRIALQNLALAAARAETNKQLENEIEHRRRTEDQALFAQKLESLGTLAGGIAHDFNNLLAGIQGSVELAMLPTADAEAVTQHLRTIHKTGQQAKVLIEQLLIYAGGPTSFVQPVDLTERIESIVPLLLTASRTSAPLVFETDPNLPWLMGDQAQLDQMVMNIVTNAADATGDRPGVITIRTGVVDTEDGHESADQQPDEGPVRIFLEVEDPGCGLSGEAQKRMFEPFFTTKGPGRGLGLASLQGIVRSHNGTILVASTQGEGTLFRVEFPVELNRPTTVPPSVQAAPKDPARMRVLVVDDDTRVRDTTVAMLQACGVETEDVSSGEAAIDRLLRGEPVFDAVVIDMVMPGLKGFETYQALRSIQSTLFPVFVSGLVVDPLVQSLVSQGQAAFLQKPFSIPELMDKLGLNSMDRGEGHAFWVDPD